MSAASEGKVAYILAWGLGEKVLFSVSQACIVLLRSTRSGRSARLYEESDSPRGWKMFSTPLA